MIARNGGLSIYLRLHLFNRVDLTKYFHFFRCFWRVVSVKGAGGVLRYYSCAAGRRVLKQRL